MVVQGYEGVKLLRSYAADAYVVCYAVFKIYDTVNLERYESDMYPKYFVKR